MTENDIVKICEKYKITNYTINSDMSIDVDGDVNGYKDQYDENKLPLSFNKVSGYVNFDRTNLTSLEGCPKYVGDSFECENTQIKSLKGIPNYIGTDFFCGKNKLDLIEYRWILYSTIGGTIVTGNSIITDFMNAYKNPSKRNLPKVLSEFKMVINTI